MAMSPMMSLRRAEEEPGDARDDPGDATMATSAASGGREREEVRPARACAAAAVVLLAQLARPRLGHDHRGAAAIVGFFGDGREASGSVAARGAAARARAEDAVSPLELRPVHGEVGLWMSSFGSAPSLGYPATPSEIVARIGSLEVSTSEGSLGDGSADALGDLERVSRARLGQKDGELLSAEASGTSYGAAACGRRRRCPCRTASPARWP